MEICTKQLIFAKRALTGLLAAALILAPGLSNPAFVTYLATGTVYAQTVTTYTYDNNGNMLSRTTGGNTDTFTYDAENRLISANVQSGANPGISSYTYDDDGLRTSATTAGATTSFLLDKNRANTQVVLERTASAFVDYTYGHRLISQNRTGFGSRFYLSDGQLSTRQLVSQTGLVTDTYTYDAFGELLASTVTTPNNYRYAGEQFDPNSNFYYLRARYYNQATGRFNTTDPLEGSINSPLSLHRYLYADSDPVNKIDPSGREPISLATVAIVLGIIGLVSLGIGSAAAFQSFARAKAEGRTSRFLYKPCGAWLIGFFATGGAGSAVIGEQPPQSGKDGPPRARKYDLSFRGFAIGGELSGEIEQDQVPFSTYKNQNRLPESFVGDGLLGNFLEGKALIGGAVFSDLILPEGSQVRQVISLSSLTKPKKWGLELALGSAVAVHFVGLDTSTRYFEENNLLCAIPPNPKQ
jgi:RHS repeat-associated protein